MANVRRKGHNYERKIVKEINSMDIGYFVGTSRLFNPHLDSKKVDIVDVPESKKRFPFHIQCKSYTGYYKYDPLFHEFSLKDKPLVVFHELTEKHGRKFMSKGEYVVMSKECFYNLIKQLDNDNGSGTMGSVERRKR